VAVGVSTSNCTASSNSGKFYILSDSSISGYSISSGALTAISGSSYTLTGASAMAISPSGGVLYVATVNGIYPFTVNTSTGALTQGTVLGFSDPQPQSIQVDASGSWLLDASDQGFLYAIPITSSGTMDTSRLVNSQVPSQPLKTATVTQMAIAPNESVIAVALGNSGVEAYPFTSSPGANANPIGTPYGSMITPYGGSAGASVAVAIDPQSRLLYIGETAAFPSSTTNSGALRAFTIGTGSLNEITMKPYAPLGTGPYVILPDATGDYVYAASWQSGPGVVTGYSVTTSALTAITNTVATGTQPSGMAEDSTGNFVLAVSSTGNTFDAYTFDATTPGQLDPLVASSPVTNPIAIVAIPK
jgi:6-phosphogluconolactonase (cycloisomerase 2 family)